MGIRKGVEEIEKRNKEVARRSGQSWLPRLQLADGDVAVMRMLNDDPLDVDMHEIYDPTVSKMRQYVYCQREEKGSCELCDEIGDEGGMKFPLVRMFFFWTYVNYILHRNPDDDGIWEKETVGGKTYYIEPVNTVRLLRSKFGLNSSWWKPFGEALEAYGTWKDREYRFKRSGKALDTVYSLTALDKSPMPKEVSSLIGKLPSLEAVTKGIVTKLELEEQGVEEKPAEEKPRVVVDLPEDTEVEE